MNTQPQGDYWALYRKLEKTIRDIQESQDNTQALSVFLESLVEQYHEVLGIEEGRIYHRESNFYVLMTAFGRYKESRQSQAAPGYRIPVTYPIIERLRQEKLLIADHLDPAFDPSIEGPLDVDTFAAITVGPACEWIISFTLAAASNREHVLYSLNTVRHVIDWKLHQSNVEGQFLHMQEIQSSLFPRKMPSFPGFDIYGHSRPTEKVGGDVYDFITLGPHILGVLVADSSGHGLAAALQARDVVIGMRMGLEDNLKIISVVEKLNRVIHRTSLSSKFVSLFYGELEKNGNFIYCDAGHVPTLYLHQGEFTLLAKGGPVLGPSPRARYQRDYISMKKGDILVLYTDGITEAHDRQDQEFGLRQLKEVIQSHAHRTARQITDAVFAAVARFSSHDPLRDDQTVVTIKRTAPTQ
ncbi:MAG: PP2C family protein-serine/threonine phosphatase [Acidobacteriota bacterium]